MSQTQQNQYDAEPADARPCSCEKKQCMIGIASIAIGIGGFVLASLL